MENQSRWRISVARILRKDHRSWLFPVLVAAATAGVCLTEAWRHVLPAFLAQDVRCAASLAL